MNPQLLALIIQEVPGVIALAKSLFLNRHPEEPQPTDEEVIAALQQALASSLAKDADWLAAHPRADVWGADGE